MLENIASVVDNMIELFDMIVTMGRTLDIKEIEEKSNRLCLN